MFVLTVCVCVCVLECTYIIWPERCEISLHVAKMTDEDYILSTYFSSILNRNIRFLSLLILLSNLPHFGKLMLFHS